MNIALVTGRFPQLSETFVYRQALGLAQRGHRVTVACREEGDWKLYPDQRPPNLSVVTFPTETSLKSPRGALRAVTNAVSTSLSDSRPIKRLWQLCRASTSSRSSVMRQFVRHVPFASLEADLVHFEFLGGGVFYPLVASMLEIPIVVSCRGQDIHTLELRPDDEQQRSIACLRDADAIHCVSEELAREVARLSGRTHAVWVNRPAVDTSREAVTPTRDGPLRIVASGRLTWVKGYDYLFTALGILARRGIDFSATILGDGELRNSLNFSIFDLGLEGRVELAGGMAANEAIERVRSSDVFVLSSVAEGISNAVLEAMAAGVPVVTTDAGGMTEAVSDGVEGFVVPIRDAKALADRLERLANDPTLRARMGTAARSRAVSEFTATRQLATFEAIYDSLVEARR